jgi:hypothetical protein
MLPIYWICFIFGGVFVLLAAIGGVDGVDVEQADIGDAGLDAELDAELDSNFDGDAASNLDLDIDQAPPSLADTDLEWSTIPRRLRAIWQILRSFKFWTFGLCFFGLTGLVLSQLSVSAGLALALAIGMGVALGSGMAATLRFLYNRQRNSLLQVQDVLGWTGNVEIPFNSSSRGRVSFKVKGVVVEYTAYTKDDDELILGQTVLAVRYERDKLWVTSQL